MTLSHRFKSSPAIPGNATDFRAAGYMMNAGYLGKNIVSSGDLNRGRRTESRVLFGYFLHDAKSVNPFSFAGRFEVLPTSNQRTKLQLRTNLIKTFENFYILFVRHKKYDKKAFAPFGAARSACIPPPSAASQKRKDPFCL